MTDRLAQHCRFSEEYNAAYRIFSSATVGSQRKASLRYCPGQTTTILISGFSFARSKKRAENLRRRSSALGAGLEPVRCRQRRILSLVSHDFLHFLPHRSTAESPCNSVVFGLFCIFKKTSICKKKHIWGELGQN